ncbi:MAG: hypothetical protein R3E67_01650 [Pseudomonadales bacterium]
MNGKLFEEMLPPASFRQRDAASAAGLLCAGLEPYFTGHFGSLFSVHHGQAGTAQPRRTLHHEKNILKLIKPLFLDALWEEFDKIKSNKNKLYEFHGKLRRLKFLDPACGY